MDMLENNHYSYKDDKHYLEIWANNPDNSLAASVQHGVFEFALYKQREVLLFYYRIKNVMDSWQSIPFNIHFSEDNEIVLPRYTFLAHDKAKLHISLIDAKTEKTKVTRTVSLSRDFSLELASILRSQSSYPFSYHNFVQTQAAIMSRYKETEDIIKNATIRCVSGSIFRA